MKVKANNKQFLIALQISDSFFPIGSYTLSYGLETFVQDKRIQNESDLEELIKDYISQLGRADCIALANSHRACFQKDVQRIVEIDDRLYAIKLVDEFRESSVKAGKNMLRVVSQFFSDKVLETYTLKVFKHGAPGNIAVSWGVLTSTAEIPLNNAIMMMLHSFTVGILGAAIRLGIIDHVIAQKIIYSMASTIVSTMEENIEKPLECMYAFAPVIDVMGMKHKRSKERMFIS